MNPDQYFALNILGLLAIALPLTLAIAIPVGRAWARRVEAGGRSGSDPGAEAELQELRGRVAELEERLDFTERVLAAHREAPPVGDGRA